MQSAVFVERAGDISTNFKCLDGESCPPTTYNQAAIDLLNSGMTTVSQLNGLTDVDALRLTSFFVRVLARLHIEAYLKNKKHKHILAEQAKCDAKASRWKKCLEMQ